MVASEIESQVERCFAESERLQGGKVADYIPELASCDPQAFALTVCSKDGALLGRGGQDVAFSLQSMCKPVLYAAALEEFGRDEVHRYVGVEPSGEPFNSYIRLNSQDHLPHNPMINAGAIAISSLLASRHSTSWLISLIRSFAARDDVHVDMATFLSERATADRNRAIGFLIQHFKGLVSEVEASLDFYFHACSALVNSRDIAVMGATLANGGVNPVSGARLLSPRSVRDVLTVMTTCGMYDGSGRFARDTGLPAKSGVSGGVFAVVPQSMGFGAYSPRLDAQGNSVRATHVLGSLSSALGLHTFAREARRPSPPSDRIEVSESGREQAPDSLWNVGALKAALNECRSETGGQVADYAEELSAVDPELYSVAVCDLAGTVVSAGDDTTRFSMQAASNPFTFALALEHAGAERVRQVVGVEPSGNPFFAVRFDPATGRPHNPFGNAGAIAVASLLAGADCAARLKNLVRGFSEFAGTQSLPVDAGIVAAERRAGNRNRAIAYLLRNEGVIADVEAALELYFQQCSVLVTVADLARMGATLANGGVNPITNRRVVSNQVAREVNAVMYMCGMHDESGRFAFDVGMPSKSGASGGVVASVPGRFGIGVYSPRIDESGTSVRGAAVLRSLAGRLRAGVFDS